MSLVKVLMERDGITQEEAAAEVADARQEFNERMASDDPGDLMDFMQERFGLEPDYLDEFLV